MSKHKPSNQLTWGELQQRIRKEVKSKMLV